MRVTVNTDRCDSNGLCTNVAPGLFALDDDDNLVILVEEPAPDAWEAAEQAARACPKFAITLLEDHR